MSPRHRRPLPTERPTVNFRMVSDRSLALHAHLILALEAPCFEEDQRLALPPPEECAGKRRLRVAEPGGGLGSE